MLRVHGNKNIEASDFLPQFESSDDECDLESLHVKMSSFRARFVALHGYMQIDPATGLPVTPPTNI